MSARWLVERTRDNFEDVGADSLLIEHGSLAFFDDRGELTIAYAAGQWLTVVPNEAT